MILEIVGILCLLTAYKLIFKPWRRFKWYESQLKGLGYVLYTKGYSVFGGSSIRNYQLDFKKYGDANHSLKYEYWKYDLLLDHFFNNIFIAIISPDLISHCFTSQKLEELEKSENLFAGLMRQVLGESIVFTNSITSWKQKRAILSEIFNFDFIRSQMPLILITGQTHLQILEDLDSREVFLAGNIKSLIGAIASRMFLGIDGKTTIVDGLDLPNYLCKYLEVTGQNCLNPEILFFGPKMADYFPRASYQKMREMTTVFESLMKGII